MTDPNLLLRVTTA